MVQATAAVQPSISEQATSASIEVGGASVTLYDSGLPVNGTASRAPIVLLHGTGGTALSHFGFLLPILALNQRVIALDFAPVADLEAMSLDDLVAQARAVIKHAVDDAPVTVLGYSLGAVVAAALAARHPEVTKNLVLVAGWMATDAQQRLRNSVWTALFDAKSPQLAEFTVFTAFSPSFLRAMAPAQLQRSLQSIRPGPFDAAQMRINRDVDIAAEVACIKAPTLVVGCARDQMVPAAHSKALFGLIDDCRYYEADCGHAIIFERPAELAQLVDQFNEQPDRHAPGVRIANDRP